MWAYIAYLSKQKHKRFYSTLLYTINGIMCKQQNAKKKKKQN